MTVLREGAANSVLLLLPLPHFEDPGGDRLGARSSDQCCIDVHRHVLVEELN